MDPDDQLLLEVEGAIMNILGFLPSDKAAE